MAVRGVSNVVCSHSHLWHPLCSKLALSTRVINVFFLALAVVIVSVIYRAMTRPTPPIKARPSNPGSEKATTSTPVKKSPPVDGSSVNPAPVSHVSTDPILSSVLKIPSFEQISKLPEIVGVSLDTIQPRARPAESSGETQLGYIENKDSLLDVIRKNWGEAQKAGITHAEISDHLGYLIEAARKSPGKPIPYDVRTRTSDAQASVENMPRFTVMFFNKKDDPDTDIFRGAKAKKEVGASYEQALIVNTAVQGKYIRWTPVREKYIREFGFYAKGMEFETVYTVLMGRIKEIPE